MEKKVEESSGIEVWRAKTLYEYYQLAQAHIKDVSFFWEKSPLPAQVSYFAHESLDKAVFLVKQLRIPESKLSWIQRKYFDDHERASEVKQPWAFAFCYLWDCIDNFNQFEDEIGGADYGAWPRRPSVEAFEILGWSALSVIDQFTVSIAHTVYSSLKSVYGIEDSVERTGTPDLFLFWDFVEYQTVILEPTLEPRALEWLQRARRDIEKDLPISKWPDSKVDHDYRRLCCELNFEEKKAWEEAKKYEVGHSIQDSAIKEMHTLEGMAKTECENGHPSEKMLTVDKLRLEVTSEGATERKRKAKSVKGPLQESETKITEADKLPERPAILINCAWEDPLTPEQVRQTEEDCGPLASTLAELAQIVREADWSTEAGLFLKDTYKLILKARVSAIQLRPKIELVIGDDQAADFYKELVNTLRFYESTEGPYACWCGADGKAEGIARKLERWHKNILLLTKPEIAVTQRDKKPVKGPLLESIHKAYEDFVRFAEPEVKMDGLTFVETAYAEAVVIDYLTEQFGEQDDALGNWPSDWHECPEAFELYKAKIREFRAGQAKASLDEVRRIAEEQTTEEMLKIIPTNAQTTSEMKAKGWEEITIEVVDDNTIKYKINEKRWKRANYTELGFLDRRKNQANQLWPIFLGLASKNLPSNIYKPKMQPKDIDRIRDRLRKFFGIQNLPIIYDKRSKEYRCNFRFNDPRDWTGTLKNENLAD